MKLFKLTTFAVAILTLGFMVQSCSTSKTINSADLKGYWSLKTLKGEAASDAFKGNIPSLEFDLEKGMVNGSGGCNSYFGQYTLVGDVFNAPNIGSTMKMCMEANKEDLFTSTLGTKDLALSVDKDILTFKDNGTVVLEFAKGKTPAAVVAFSADKLVGTWVLNKIKGDDASKLFGKNPATLVYSADGKVSGNGGCNNYRGTATLDGSVVTFGPLMSTKMACEHLEGEQTYTTLLSNPVQAAINGDKLVFSQDGKAVLEYTKSAE